MLGLHVYLINVIQSSLQCAICHLCCEQNHPNLCHCFLQDIFKSLCNWGSPFSMNLNPRGVSSRFREHASFVFIAMLWWSYVGLFAWKQKFEVHYWVRDLSLYSWSDMYILSISSFKGIIISVRSALVENITPSGVSAKGAWTSWVNQIRLS